MPVPRHKRRGFNSWVRKMLGVENGNSLQYSCLENSMHRKSRLATVDRVPKGWTWTEHEEGRND